MSEFDAIRPYNDNEVKDVLKRLLSDNEFIDAVVKFKLPHLGRFLAPVVRPRVRTRLSKELKNVSDVKDFQDLLEGYIQGVLDKTVDNLSVSGLENLDASRAHLFVSNHRDIAMDPAFVNWTLYHNGFTTLRIAIGDNLLTKPFASDLMRLNKSFVVNRSATAPREKLKAAKLLSKYIHHSVVNENENVWIAHREGRAKDGLDLTNPAIVSMLMLHRNKTDDFGEYVKRLRIVPVSISYEYDPCDDAKAREISTKEQEGQYVKGEHEDVKSIARGIVGYKGSVHLSFGAPLGNELSSADAVTEALDRRISEQYVLHPTNCFAFEMLEGVAPVIGVGEKNALFDDLDFKRERKKFEEHVSQCDAPYRDTLLNAYANPVRRKLSMAVV